MLNRAVTRGVRSGKMASRKATRGIWRGKGGAVAFVLLLVLLGGCGKHTLTEVDLTVSCPDLATAKVPSCEELCSHTTALPGRCGQFGDKDLCVETCRQVFDQPTTTDNNRLRACYLTATSCEQIAGCNVACYVPPPIPDASDDATRDASTSD